MRCHVEYTEWLSMSHKAKKNWCLLPPLIGSIILSASTCVLMWYPCMWIEHQISFKLFSAFECYLWELYNRRVEGASDVLDYFRLESFVCKPRMVVFHDWTSKWHLLYIFSVKRMIKPFPCQALHILCVK